MESTNDTEPFPSPPQTLEITESTPLLSTTSPTPDPPKSIPSIEIHLYKQGKGRIAVFKAELGGWEQDQLDVREILEKYGLKRIYAFSPSSGRSVPIRFGRNGRSVLGYKDGAVVCIDGEPKFGDAKGCGIVWPFSSRYVNFNTQRLRTTTATNPASYCHLGQVARQQTIIKPPYIPEDSLIKPITKILVGVAVVTILIAIFVKETPAWAEKLNLRGTRIPPWLITCAIIVFTRWRKRTRDFLQNRGGENRMQPQRVS
ncbi:hypothetical protein AKJ16_DCAP13235 [Drosera capensis]